MRRQLRVATAVLLLLPAVRSAPAAAQDADSATNPWSFQFITYVWLPELQGSIMSRGLTADVEVDFDQMFDLLGNGDLFAAGGHFEARYDRFSFFLDAFGGTARPDSNVSFGPNDNLTGKAGLTMNFTFFEFGPAYRVLEWPKRAGERPITIDLLTGGRLMYFYESISLKGTGGLVDRFVKSSSTWVDPFVGGRFAVPLVGDLDLVFRGDIGGFGAGSELVWNLIGGFQYGLPWRPFGTRTSVVAVYKALDFDYETGSGPEATDLELDLRGPAIGFGMQF